MTASETTAVLHELINTGSARRQGGVKISTIASRLGCSVSEVEFDAAVHQINHATCVVSFRPNSAEACK
jgi:hypothetical protein